MTPATDALIRCLLRRAGGAVDFTRAELEESGTFLLRETHEGVHLEYVEI